MSASGREQLLSDWYRFAGEDLAAARELASRGTFHHQACLLCQQSAEKYLKAYLLSRGWKLVKTHELSPLVSECLTYDESFADLFNPCELLNGYVVQGRYPGDLPFEGTTARNAQEAVSAASQIEGFILGRRGHGLRAAGGKK